MFSKYRSWYGMCATFSLFQTRSDFHHRSVLPKLMECSTDDDVAMCFVSQASDFEKYLQYIVGQSQAEACIHDKNTQHFFQVMWQETVSIVYTSAIYLEHAFFKITVSNSIENIAKEPKYSVINVCCCP